MNSSFAWRALAVLVALSLVITATWGGTAAAPSSTIVVTSYGGPWEQFLRKEILPGFESETGAKVELSVGLSRDWVAKIRAAGLRNPPFDVIIANTTWVSAVRKEGFFAKLTPEAVPNLKDVWPELRNTDDVGVDRKSVV